MNGSIRCVRCHKGIDEAGDGICPKCKISRSYEINFYWSHAHGGDGKHHHLRFGLDWARTRAKLRTLRSAIDEKTFDPAEWGLHSGENSFGKRMDEYLLKVEGAPEGDYAPATKARYKTESKRILACKIEHNGEQVPIGDIDVKSLDYPDYESLVKVLPGRGTTKRTTKKFLHAFLSWCRENRYILIEPKLPIIRAKDAKLKYTLIRQEQKEALSRLPVERRDLYDLMMTCGARVSEILTLKVGDIRLGARAMTINRTYSEGKIKENTKTNNPRTLPLVKKALRILERNIKGKKKDAFVFSHEDGTPYTYREINEEWRTKSGYGWCPLKDSTRRSFATQMRNAKMPVDVVSKLLGHTSIKTTEGYLDHDVTWAADMADEAEAEAERHNTKAKRVRNEKKPENH